jgi:hypothetical protein
MTPDEPEPPDELETTVRYTLDEDDGDHLPPRSYWWSLYRPETYALTGLAIGVLGLLGNAANQAITQAVFLNGPSSERALLLTSSGIRLGFALLGILAAVLSIRSEDDDVTWSPPVARSGLLIGALGAAVAVASLIATLLSSLPDNFTIGG